MQTFLEMALLFVVVFIQNMTFTITSRSRNSGDANYHRWAALMSNGTWFAIQVLLFNSLWKKMMEGQVWVVVIGGIVYTVATSEGSVFMMKVLLGQSRFKWLNKKFAEKDKRKVGS